MFPIYTLCIIDCSDSGGGGERVLWVLLKGLLTNTVESRTAKKDLCSVVDKYDVKIVIYSGEASKSKEDILENVQVLFCINFRECIILNVPFHLYPTEQVWHHFHCTATKVD